MDIKWPKPQFSGEFEAVFCPRCGECVNMPAEILNVGPEANCGWCKKRHSIDQIKVCRQLAHVSERERMAGARASLLKIRDRLSVKIAPVFTKLAFTVDECDELLLAIDERRQRVAAAGEPTAVLWSLHTAVAEARTELKRTEEKEDQDGLHDGIPSTP